VQKVSIIALFAIIDDAVTAQRLIAARIRAPIPVNKVAIVAVFA